MALVGNGTDALTLAIGEVLGPGDGESEIVTASHTFVATAEAITNAGYRPVFADIDPQTCLLSLGAVEEAISLRRGRLSPCIFTARCWTCVLFAPLPIGTGSLSLKMQRRPMAPPLTASDQAS